VLSAVIATLKSKVSTRASPIIGVDRVFRAPDGRKSVDRPEGDMDVIGFERGGEIFDVRRSGVDLNARALFFRSEFVARRMGRRVGGYHLKGIAAVGKQAGIEGVELVDQIILQQQPPVFAIAAVVKRINQLIVVVVMGDPLDANRVAIPRGRHGRFVARLVGICPAAGAAHIDCAAQRFGHGLVAHSDLHAYIVDVRSNILRQVVQNYAVHSWCRVAGM